MRRVYLMYCTREACKPIPRLTIALVLVLALVGSVSTLNVLTNALQVSGVTGLALFFLSAFAQAEPVVKIVTVLLAAMIAWAAYDASRHLKLVTKLESI